MHAALLGCVIFSTLATPSLAESLIRKAELDHLGKVRFTSPAYGALESSISNTTDRNSGLNILFITDCSSHQRWMAFGVFNSASHAGQKDPITWLRSGCNTTHIDRDVKLARALYGNAKVEDVHSDKWGSDFNLGFGIPKALHSYFASRASLDNNTVLALIEADMVFLKELRIDDLATHGLPARSRKMELDGSSFIGRGVGVVSTYDCCGGLGPPYIFTVQSWREIVFHWNEVKSGSIWGADQQVFSIAARKAHVHMNAFEHLMVMRRTATRPGWRLLEEAVKTPVADVCTTGSFGQQPGVPDLPVFFHIVQPWHVTNHASAGWGFSKYQVPPGWKRERPYGTDGILDCRMPFFAEPPTNLLQASGTQKVQSWIVCTVIHSLNSMLTKYKQVACPSGYNTAKALQMKVPLNWENLLWDIGLSSAPNGTDPSWLQSCAEHNAC